MLTVVSWLGDASSAVAALIAAIQLALTANPSAPRSDAGDEFEEALYRLRAYLDYWHARAVRTDEAASAYVDALDRELPTESWRAAETLLTVVSVQRAVAGDVATLNRLLDGPAGTTLLAMLEIHADAFRDLHGQLRNRYLLLRGLRDELDAAYAAGGRAGTASVLDALANSADDLGRASAKVAGFIRDRFPVGRPSGAAG
jgi:hypothetical protein